MKKRLLYLLVAVMGAATAMAGCSAKSAEAADANAGVTESQPAVNKSKSAVIHLAQGASLPDAKGKLMVIDFNANWCGPCRQFAPHFSSVAREYGSKAVFVSVNVDQHPELAQKYRVSSIPMVVYVLPDGRTDQTVGYMERDRFAAIIDYLLNMPEE